LKLRQALCAIGASVALAVGGVGLSTGTASAHTGGQPHTHWAGCTSTDCWVWMLANGTWHRGPFSKVQEQWGFIETLCSNKSGAASGGIPASPWGWYPYGGDTQDRNFWSNYGCRIPEIGGWEWSLVQ
jgi:hypothetical protein